MTSLDFQFRFADLQDKDDLSGLITEATLHYWSWFEAADEMGAKTTDALLNGSSGCRAILAYQGGVAKGFATISVLHMAPNESGTLFMKDLYVSKDARRSGLGKAFMHFLARHAVELGCHRFDWTAESDNQRAVSFYDDLSASRVDEKVYFRFSGDELNKFASEE